MKEKGAKVTKYRRVNLDPLQAVNFRATQMMILSEKWKWIATLIVFAVLLLLVGVGWGIYYGNDIYPAYDRAFFRVGTSPKSHEIPALAMFGIGLIGPQAIWTWAPLYG